MPHFKVPVPVNSIFQTTIEVRINDINYGNHLGHDSLISLIHEARMRLLKKLGYQNELIMNGLGILVTNLFVNYINEAHYGDKLIINIGVDKITKTSIDFLYQILNDKTQKEIARVLTTVTFFDYKQGKIARIPREFMEHFNKN